MIVAKTKIFAKVFDFKIKCHFCKEFIIEGNMYMSYMDNSEQVLNAVACIKHSICIKFLEEMNMCQNHSEGIEGECNSVPF